MSRIGFFKLTCVVVILLLYQLPDASSDESESRHRQEWGDDDRCRPERPPVSSESDMVEEDVPEVPVPVPTISVRPVKGICHSLFVNTRTQLNLNKIVISKQS